MLRRIQHSPSHLRTRSAVLLASALVAGAAAILVLRIDNGSAARNPRVETDVKRSDGKLYLTDAQWTAVTVQTVELNVFRSEFRTEGKIAIDEDRTTRIFAPYAGRVTKLLAAPGDKVEKDQLIFVVEAADSVEAQKDFVTALTARNKATSQVALAQIVEQRMAALAKDKAAPLREWQEAQTSLATARNDLRSAEVAFQAARNRLRLVGKTNAEIDAFENTGLLTTDAPVYSPLAGTILQRKVGPGQYVNAGANDSDPAFLIGDTSKVWLAAFVRESDAAKVRRGQQLAFKVLTHPDHTFESRIDYIAPAIDPDTRRLLVRATLDNPDGLLKPEMFANVTIIADEGQPTPAVPRNAVIYEDSTARVWAVRDDRSVELRRIRLGLVSDRLIQVLEGLQPGERIVTRGSLFIDRMTAANQT